ncbi:MAG: hypothetical protein ACKVOB_09695 [Sphingomonas sp.]
MKKPSKKGKAPGLDGSQYYGLLVDNFSRLLESDTDKVRAYVSALSLCFDAEKVHDVSIGDICENHVFDVDLAGELGFVLARKQFSHFYIDDLDLPGVKKRRIRDTSVEQFEERFERNPLTYRQSKLWCTVAEWYTLLGLGKPPKLPTVIRDFALESGVRLPD